MSPETSTGHSSDSSGLAADVAQVCQHLRQSLPPDPLDGGGRIHRQAHEIPVEAYDLILVWPVRIKDCAQEPASAAGPEQDSPPGAPFTRLDQWVPWITCDEKGPWHEDRRPFPCCEDEETAEREFSEFVYFHPFVRNFLYTNRDDLRAGGEPCCNRNLRILRRTDVTRLTATVFLSRTRECRTVSLDVQRVELYLFDTGIALLVLRATWPKPPAARPSLEEILKLQDVIRRLYAPYWFRSGGFHGAGHCPDELMLEIGGQTLPAEFGGYPADSPPDAPRLRAVHEQLEHVRQHREPKAVAPWQRLLEPVTPVTCRHPAAASAAGTAEPAAPGHGPRLQFAHIEDERLQLFSYIAVPNPRQISPGDWVRLATVDDPGDSDCYPYSPAFLRGRGFGQFAYDRFWDPSGRPPATDAYTSTRWLCCGYGFTGVGCSQDEAYFADAQAGGRAHFQHHYFKLGLIAHFHRASLLNFKVRIANALEEWRAAGADAEHGRTRFARALAVLQRDFLMFRNMYWFTELTNQIQGRELFDMWSQHLNTRPLFEQIKAELQEAEQIVSAWQQQRMVQEQDATQKQLVKLAKRQGALQKKLVDVVTEQRNMNRNIEWVEVFIVAAYAIEFVAAVAHQVHDGHTVIAMLLLAFAIAVAGIASCVLDLWEHLRHERGRRLWKNKSFLLLAMFLLPVLLAGGMIAHHWLTQPANAPAPQPHHVRAPDSKSQ